MKITERQLELIKKIEDGEEGFAYGYIASVYEDLVTNPHYAPEVDAEGHHWKRMGYNAGWFRGMLRKCIDGKKPERIEAAYFVGCVMHNLAIAILNNKHDVEFIKPRAERAQDVWEGKAEEELIPIVKEGVKE